MRNRDRDSTAERAGERYGEGSCTCRSACARSMPTRPPAQPCPDSDSAITSPRMPKRQATMEARLGVAAKPDTVIRMSTCAAHGRASAQAGCACRAGAQCGSAMLRPAAAATGGLLHAPLLCVALSALGRSCSSAHHGHLRLTSTVRIATRSRPACSTADTRQQLGQLRSRM